MWVQKFLHEREQSRKPRQILREHRHHELLVRKARRVLYAYPLQVFKPLEDAHLRKIACIHASAIDLEDRQNFTPSRPDQRNCLTTHALRAQIWADGRT